MIDETEKRMGRPITDLLEWGCVLLDRNPRGPGEHAWHVAAVVLLQGVGDFSFLLGPPGDKYRDPTGGQRLRSLARLDHATVRFPDDDWFRLPKIIPLLWLAASGPQHTTTLDEKTARAAIRREVRAEPPWYRTKIVEIETIPWARHYVRLWEFVAALEPLLKYEKILGEIHLHLGYAYLRLARLDLALEHLRQVPARTEDRSLLYMSWYLSGRAYQAAGDRTRAIAAYRTAIGMMRGQSAAFALAALLFNTDGRNEAFDLVQETLAVRPPVPDPWRVYGMGDFRLWAPNIERVRAEVRQR